MGTQLDTLLNEAPMTSKHWRVWLLAASGIMLDGFDFFIIGVASPLIAADLGASPKQIGLVAAAAIVGAIIGAVCLGRLTDRLGRKLAFRLDLGLFVVFALLSGLAWNIPSLIAFRFILGIGVGADYPISAAYVAEIAPARHRVRLLVGAFSFQAVGQVLGALVGLCILVTFDSVTSWRYMLAFGAVPALLIILLRRGVPESPKWLAAQGQHEEAAEVVSLLVGQKVEASMIEADAQEAPEEAGSFRELFQGGLRRLTLLTTVPWFLMDIATYGIGVFTPVILATLAIQGDGSTLSDAISSTEGAVVIDLFLLVGFAVALVLITRFRHTNMQIAGFMAMAAGLVILSFSTSLTEGSVKSLVLVFAGFILFNICMNAGPNSTTFLLPAEVFPTRVRATGHGLATAAGKTGAAVGVFFFPILEADLGLGVLLPLIAGGCILAAVVTGLVRIGVVASDGVFAGQSPP
ncbi:MAG: MFS transporter [Microthrixaceae bacterium]